MQKGFSVPLLLLGILVVCGVIFSYVFYVKTSQKNYRKVSPNPKQETPLKVYSNQELDFEFQYVEGVEVKIDSEEEFNQRGNGDFRKNFTYYVTYPPANVLGAFSVLDETGSFEMSPFTVWVFENSNDLTIEKWYNNFWYYPFVWGDYTASRNNVAPMIDATISGQIAKLGVVSYQPGSPKFIYLNHSGKMYLIRIINKQENLEDQILESFKFTN